jgi:hypoxanthine-guanine phosphoribosyltransferase
LEQLINSIYCALLGQIMTVSTRRKVFIVIGILAGAGIFATILWGALRDRSTSQTNEFVTSTEHSRKLKRFKWNLHQSETVKKKCIAVLQRVYESTKLG